MLIIPVKEGENIDTLKRFKRKFLQTQVLKESTKKSLLKSEKLRVKQKAAYSENSRNSQ